MPKIKNSKSKPDLFEVMTTQTRWGKRITCVPVKDSQPSPAPSRSASPLKKWARSPGVPELNDNSNMDQVPKHSRTVGKVHITAHVNFLQLDKGLLQTQNEFLKEYLSWRHSILIEILQYESPPSRASCSNCQQTSGTHRCQDCFGLNFWCGTCCVSTHAHLPFHRVQMWNGHFFKPSDLLAQRLCLDLCHHPDDCGSIPPSTETQMMFELDLPNADEDLLDGYQPLDPSESTTHFGSRSNLTIVSSTGIFTCSGVIALNPRTNMFNFSFVRSFSLQVSRTQKQHLRSRFWTTSK